MTAMVVVLPKVLTVAVFVFAVLGSMVYYVLTHYQIDYKYCLSFISQLVGLILFVISFLLVFILGANLIMQ